MSLILAAALFITSPLQSVDPGELPYSDTMTSTDVTECRETLCEEWAQQDDGSLLCYSSDEVYGLGHFHFEISPEFMVNLGYPNHDGPWETRTELQAWTEY